MTRLGLCFKRMVLAVQGMDYSAQEWKLGDEFHRLLL